MSNMFKIYAEIPSKPTAVSLTDKIVLSPLSLVPGQIKKGAIIIERK